MNDRTRKAALIIKSEKGKTEKSPSFLKQEDRELKLQLEIQQLTDLKKQEERRLKNELHSKEKAIAVGSLENEVL